MPNRYFVAGGTGNWNSTTNWSASSGGASGASFPVAGDDVFLDENSGSGTLTINVASACGSLDCTGFTGTLARSTSTLTLNNAGGVLKFVAGMTMVASTGAISITPTSGTFIITSADKVIGALTINAPGAVVQIADAIRCQAGSTSTLTLSAGTFDGNGFDVYCRLFSSSNSAVRTLNMGGGTWYIGATNVGGVNTIWNTFISTNFTFNKGASNVVVTSQQTCTSNITVGSVTNIMNSWTLQAGVSGSVRLLNFSGSTTITFSAFELNAPAALRTSSNITATTINFLGFNYTDRLLIASDDLSSARTFTQTTGPVETDYAILRCIAAAGGATWKAGRHSIDMGGNSGWSFTSTVTHSVAGVTKDNSGAALGTCEAILLKKMADGSVDEVGRQTTDVSGNYLFDAYDNDPQHYVVARKAGSPNVADVSDYVTPV